jgi:UDP-3-O-[3-hydroxymyristoyl] glucosamine N-acyltransferase
MSNLIGNAPNQVPTNADLGDLAYQDADHAILGNLNVENSVSIAGPASVTGNATINGNTTLNGNTVTTQNITLTTGNLFLQTTNISTDANAVVNRGYVDTQSIIWGF